MTQAAELQRFTMGPAADLQIYRNWDKDADTSLADLLDLFTYLPGDDRATGYLYADGNQPWPTRFKRGTGLIKSLEATLGVRFTIVAFQAYRNGGAGCDWHDDSAFEAQAILSLGATRTFGVRWLGGDPDWIKVNHGDLVYMPPGFQADRQHCVPPEDVAGERCSLVFRAVRSKT